MSPGSAATPQQKTPIKTLGESFDVTLADFRSLKEKLWQEKKKKTKKPKTLTFTYILPPHLLLFLSLFFSFSFFLLQWP